MDTSDKTNKPRRIKMKNCECGHQLKTIEEFKTGECARCNGKNGKSIAQQIAEARAKIKNGS